MNWIDKRQQTREKRKTQTCKVFELKLDSSHLSKRKSNYLKKLFLEAKWLYNDILSTKDVFKYDTKPNIVEVLNKDKVKEKREMFFLSSQMKQAVKQKIEYAIKSLSSKKKKSKNKQRIGRLKFTSNYKSLVMNQYNMTYRFLQKGKYVKFQKCKYKFKISGYQQIPGNAEFVNATLTYRHNDYYLKVTTYVPKEELLCEGVIGIDFGLKDALTLSTGEKFKLKIPENKRLRKCSRRLKKRVKRSSNYFKMKNMMNKEYHKLTNKKKDKKNKIVSKIINKYKVVICQDESIKAWHHGNYGKSVQHSLLGGIMRDLERKSHTFIKVDRFFTSTQLCPECCNKKKLTLKERIYNCSCGYQEDRDTKSALCIMLEGLKQIPAGCRESTPEEIVPLLGNYVRITEQVRSLSQEAIA